MDDSNQGDGSVEWEDGGMPEVDVDTATPYKDEAIIAKTSELFDKKRRCGYKLTPASGTSLVALAYG